MLTLAGVIGGHDTYLQQLELAEDKGHDAHFLIKLYCIDSYFFKCPG